MIAHDSVDDADTHDMLVSVRRHNIHLEDALKEMKAELKEVKRMHEKLKLKEIELLMKN